MNIIYAPQIYHNNITSLLRPRYKPVTSLLSTNKMRVYRTLRHTLHSKLHRSKDGKSPPYGSYKLDVEPKFRDIYCSPRVIITIFILHG